jgi:two-component system, sensor histidine kinase
MTATPADTNGPRTRVLIVDNEPDAARTMGMLLERRGYEVHTVLDSRQCLATLQSFLPDVVLLDIGMPLVSGYDIARQIRLQPQLSHVAIIAVSGYGDGEHVARSLESGCGQHLLKPTRLADLERAIGQEIAKCRGPGATSIPGDE